jgi:hypothetical protein
LSTFREYAANAVCPALLVSGALCSCASLIGADFDRPSATDAGVTDATTATTSDGAPVADCGACNAQEACDEESCSCTATCSGKACGADDGCGGKCTHAACATGELCVNGQCVCDPGTCPGCCLGTACVRGSDTDACGLDGGMCTRCPQDTTCGGGGQPGVCGCTPSCAGVACGARENCGKSFCVTSCRGLGACRSVTDPVDVSCCPDPPYPAQGCIPGSMVGMGIVGAAWKTADCSGEADGLLGVGGTNVSIVGWRSYRCCPSCY